MTSDLNTMTQLWFCVLSISRSANCGIDTFGSFVHCNKSERKETKHLNSLPTGVYADILCKHFLEPDQDRQYVGPDLVSKLFDTPRSAVGKVSGYRCVSDCRSRGREFDPGPVPYFRGD